MGAANPIFADVARRVALIREDGTAVDNSPEAYAAAMRNDGAQRVNSTAYEGNRVLLNKGGRLLSLIGFNNGSGGFIQLFDSQTVPADNAAPVCFFAIPGTANFSMDVPVVGMPFYNGISVAFSTTGPTKTQGAANVFFTAVVK